MHELTIAGASLVADTSGALWWPDERMLVIADLHLEKASAFARWGLRLPPYDTRATLIGLAAVIHRRAPQTVVALGDSFHDPAAARRLGRADRKFLMTLMTGRSWVWIAGNHDPAPPPDLGGDSAENLRVGPLTFRHEPASPPVSGEIAGHLHPAARVSALGQIIRSRCFATDGDRMILPAFGALTGGLNVLDAAVRPLFHEQRFRVLAMGHNWVYPIEESSLVADAEGPITRRSYGSARLS